MTNPLKWFWRWRRAQINEMGFDDAYLGDGPKSPSWRYELDFWLYLPRFLLCEYSVRRWKRKQRWI